MSRFLQRWFVTVLAVFLATAIVPGIHYQGLEGLLVAGLLLGFLNAFVRPVLTILAIPFLIVTLGLFYFVINALLLYFVGQLTPAFRVDTFGAAFWGGLTISFVSMLLNSMIGSDQPPPPSSGSRGHAVAGKDDGPVIDV